MSQVAKYAISKQGIKQLENYFSFYFLFVSYDNNNTKSFICMTIKELQYCKSY